MAAPTTPWLPWLSNHAMAAMSSNHAMAVQPRHGGAGAGARRARGACPVEWVLGDVYGAGGDVLDQADVVFCYRRPPPPLPPAHTHTRTRTHARTRTRTHTHAHARTHTSPPCPQFGGRPRAP